MWQTPIEAENFDPSDVTWVLFKPIYLIIPKLATFEWVLEQEKALQQCRQSIIWTV